MVINRRQFLQGGAGLLASGGASLKATALAAAGSGSKDYDDALFAAARREQSGGYSAALFTLHGDVRAIPLPERGHDVAVRPGGSEVVVFARRPGRFAIAFTANAKVPPVEFFAAPNRHFYGHGVFSPDGRLLYTTENDYENGAGVIGVRDAGAGYRQIGEFTSMASGRGDAAGVAARW